MQAKRYNLFNQLHKAHRRLLYHMACKIQRADFTTSGVSAIVSQLELLLLLLDEHTDNEDLYILPHITYYDADLVASFKQNHLVAQSLMESLHRTIGNWRRAETVSQRSNAGNQLIHRFNELIAFGLYHMNKEEKELLPLLWAHYSDSEIKGIEQHIFRSTDAETLTEQQLTKYRLHPVAKSLSLHAEAA